AHRLHRTLDPAHNTAFRELSARRDLRTERGAGALSPILTRRPHGSLRPVPYRRRCRCAGRDRCPLRRHHRCVPDSREESEADAKPLRLVPLCTNLPSESLTPGDRTLENAFIPKDRARRYSEEDATIVTTQETLQVQAPREFIYRGNAVAAGGFLT